MTSSDLKPFRIAIVGGSIGGLYAALAIQHYCGPVSSQPIDIDVFEQARAYREVGAGIGIGINATNLLHAIGVGERVNAIAGRRKNVWITFRRYDNGEDIITVPLDDSVPKRQAPVFRPDFLAILIDECEKRKTCRLHTQKKCEQLTENSDGTITLTFKDGSSTTADFVIGADGIHSVVRGHYHTDNAVYSGQIAYRGVVELEKVKPFWKLPTYSVNWVAPDRHILVYPISSNTKMNIVAFKYVEEKDLGELRESWSSLGTREQMLKDFDGFEEQALGAIGCMEGDVLKWKLNDRDPFEPWVFAQGRVVLLGDAAHAVLPHQGAGGGQAIEDGYILALSLRDFMKHQLESSKHESDSDLLDQYMQLYQDNRLSRAQQVQSTTREASLIYELQTPEFQGKTFEECLPIFAKIMKGRMDWIWHEQLDALYDKHKSVRFGTEVSHAE